MIEEGKFPFYARGNERIVRHAIQGHSEISASSTLKGKREKSYHANNLLDGDLKTAWCEGVAGPGHGEFIEVKLKGVAKLCPTREMTSTLVMVSPRTNAFGWKQPRNPGLGETLWPQKPGKT